MASRKATKDNGVKQTTQATPIKPTWELKLYVAGQTPRSKAAYENLKTLCEQNIPGQYQIELIDLLKNPALARADQILAIPTLIRRFPDPVKRIIGDLSDSERAMVALDIQPAT